jgi:site-specific recombinase XerD
VNAFNETTDDPIQLTPHIFRHTFCTNLMRSGVDIKTIQYLMGHTTIDMTINTYTHTTYEDVERAFNKYCSGM